MGRTLLVLDLDETLIYASDRGLPRSDFRAGPYEVVRRPFVEPFLSAVAEWFDLAVWTSAGDAYADAVVSKLFGPAADQLRFVWSASRCTRKLDPETGELCDAKPLRKLRRRGVSLARLLVVDDSPEKHRQNYGNLIRVTPFLGDPADAELRDLLPFLERLRDVPDVRPIEKRAWRPPPNIGARPG